MSYERLRGLYLGLTSNADLTTDHERHVLHVPTKLDELVPRWLAEGKDVTLTGNPGDGKSHLARRLVAIVRVRLQLRRIAPHLLRHGLGRHCATACRLS